MHTDLHDRVAAMWTALGGPGSSPETLTLSGPRQVLGSVLDVTGLATTAVALVALGVADVAGGDRAVRVGTEEACRAFLAERLFRPDGWDLPPLWDPMAGDYRTADGWIRLHTNYAHHRRAAASALDLPEDSGRPEVAAAVERLSGAALEDAVVAAGGCAAVMRSRADWLAHPAGAATAAEPPLTVVGHGDGAWRPPRGDRPLAGLRVLDITRVLAGPACTRVLAAYGADVLRLDPPGFDEVGAALPLTTQGKHCARLDLRDPAGRDRALDLLRQAHVLVHGLRPGALERLGLGEDDLRAVAPGLVIARLDAYGWAGPWAGRRGFDSLVQMSCGIAAAGAEAAGVEEPRPLPAQALDHATGHLLAAGVLRLLADSRAGTVTGSLVGTAHLLHELGPGDPVGSGLPEVLEDVHTAWGPGRAAPLPGSVAGVPSAFPVAAGPLGRHPAAWSS